MTFAAGLLLALGSTAALSCGFYLQHTASGTVPALTLQHPLWSLSALFTSWKWLAGFVIGLSGWAFYIIALGLAPLALVQATSAGGVGLLALLVKRGGGRLTRPERLAVAASAGSLVLLGLSLPAGARQASAPGWAAPLGWVLASAILAMMAAIRGRALLRPGAGLAMAAGLLYAAGDVATKAAVGRTSPVFLFAVLIPVCHGPAFAALQLGFQRGTVMATAGVSSLLTNVLPILAGLTIFAEHMPGGAAGILRGLGFAGAVLGATLLAGVRGRGRSRSVCADQRHRQAQATTAPPPRLRSTPATPAPIERAASLARFRLGEGLTHRRLPDLSLPDSQLANSRWTAGVLYHFTFGWTLAPLRAASMRSERTYGQATSTARA